MLSDGLQPVYQPLPEMVPKVYLKDDIRRPAGCIVIQTCDRYEQWWPSFFWCFDKYWDKSIPWPVYFCNEELLIDIKDPNRKQLLTGKDSHSKRMATILDSLPQYDYVFYMLEDFWLTDPMTKDMFMGLFEIMKSQDWDSLRVSTFLPEYYKVEPTEHVFQNRRILKYTKESDWQFSQQASFWKKNFLRDIIVEPQVSEVEMSTSITGEMAMDSFLKTNRPDAKIYHYHYHWYPVSGSIWRGKLSQIGEQIEFVRQVENLLDYQFG